MYDKLNERNKSSDHFRIFLRYMICERNQLNGMDKDFKDDFMYHYDNIPKYFEEFEKRNEHETLKQLAVIDMAIDKIKSGIAG